MIRSRAVLVAIGIDWKGRRQMLRCLNGQSGKLDELERVPSWPAGCHFCLSDNHPRALYAPRDSSLRLLVLAAKTTQLRPDFSALRRVERHASEYLGTLKVVTAFVVFVGMSIGHREPKPSEHQRMALLTSGHLRQRLRRISESSFSWSAHQASIEFLAGRETRMLRERR